MGKDNKICSRCGGEIDGNTGLCKVCGKEYKSKPGEMDKTNLKNWLLDESEYQWDIEGDENVDPLQKWLNGSDDALDDWIGEMGGSESVMEDIKEKRDEHIQKEKELQEKEKNINALKEKLDNLISSVEKGDLDVKAIVEENVELSKQLQDEMRIKKELQAEIEELRKGTNSIIKALKLKQKDLVTGEIKDFEEKLKSELGEKEKLHIEIDKIKEELKILREELDGKINELPEDVKELKKKDLEIKEKENERNSMRKELELEQKELENKKLELEESGQSEELKSMMAEELREKNDEFMKKENELNKKIINLESELEKLKIELRHKDDMLQLEGGNIDEKIKDLMDKTSDLQKELVEKEKELERLRDELNFKEQETKQLEGKLKFKEDELERREQDLAFREKKMEHEMRKIEDAKAEFGGIEEVQMKQRLEDLEEEIKRKEEELRAKEKYINAKEREIKAKEQGLVEEELALMEEDIKVEIREEKVKTGTRRLDDLLYGGFPLGSNILVYGPAYSGKEVLMYTFMAEGLKKGVPVIWVITDKTISQIKDDMKYVLPSYEEYEKLGLVKYIDAYSASIGEKGEVNEDAIYIENQTDTSKILKSVDKLGKELRNKHPYYRVAFFSLSTLLAYLEPKILLKFLQPFTTKRKKERAVSLYMIEKGMHSESEIQMLGYMMDGNIEFKIENLKTHLSVKGICEVQARDWIELVPSKTGIALGSFSLGHIR